MYLRYPSWILPKWVHSEQKRTQKESMRDALRSWVGARLEPLDWRSVSHTKQCALQRPTASSGNSRASHKRPRPWTRACATSVISSATKQSSVAQDRLPTDPREEKDVYCENEESNSAFSFFCQPQELQNLSSLTYVTYMQSTSRETLGWMKHKLESRLLGEISITSDMQMISPLWQKLKRN